MRHGPCPQDAHQLCSVDVVVRLRHITGDVYLTLTPKPAATDDFVDQDRQVFLGGDPCLES